MDKSCHQSSASAADSSSSSSSSSRDQYLRQLSKLSHKISKPTTIIKKPPTFDHPLPQNLPPPHHHHHPPPPQLAPTHQQNLQHQPPVYNINKNDFRDVVQKLTGSPAHDRISTPPPIHQPKPPSSRLQRIRPPPLAQISNRPPPMLAGVGLPRPQPPLGGAFQGNAVNVGGFSGFARPVAPPLSPLPPLPSVHGAADSPVSSYLRYLHSSMDQGSKQFSGFSPLAPLVSPRWNSFIPQQVQPPIQPQPQPQPLTQIPLQQQPQVQVQARPQQQQQLPAATMQAVVPSQAPAAAALSQLQFPSSPSPFGCLNSPLSSYNLFSPGLLFSPNSGQLGFPQLPLSPTVPVPSPRWRDL